MVYRDHKQLCCDEAVRAAGDDLRDFLELESGSGGERRIPENQFSSLDITFDHVSYRYEGAEEEVLKDVSFTIHQGERLALVGLNGAGKSTIVKLISGLYLPTNGAVYVNGIDTRNWIVKLHAPCCCNFPESVYHVVYSWGKCDALRRMG